MAKITGGLLSLGARGTIGKTVTFAGWRGQPYARQTVIPANPNSTAQQSTRGVFSVANAIWKAAPADFIAPWDRYAVGQKLLGRNKFVGDYVSALRGQIDMANMVFSPGAKGGLAPVSLVLTPAALQITADITAPAVPTGWTLDAALAAIMTDDDPQTRTDYAMTVTSDATAPYSIVFAGLTAATPYVVGAWLEWTKPDGTKAYGASITDQATTP